MAKPKLALIPAAQGDKFYSVLPSSGVGDFDFTRSGGATRINSQGLIETVADGVSRLNYPLIDGKVVGCPSHLLEPQRTNLITHSEDFTNAYWNKLNSVIVSDNEEISPDGTLNASLISSPNTSNNLISNSISVSANTDYTFSVFIKKDNNESRFPELYLRFYTSGSSAYEQYIQINTKTGITNVRAEFGVNSNTVEDYGDYWRLSLTTNSNTQTDCTFGFNPAKSNVFGTINQQVGSAIIFGAQLEEGSYTTSYIPTSGSAVTRSAETATNSGDASTFNDSEGVLMAEISALANDGTYRAISVSSGSTSNRVLIYVNNTTNVLRPNLVGNGVAQINAYVNVPDITNFNKVLIRYSLNNIAFWVNGYKLSEVLSATSMPIGLNKLSFDNVGGGSERFFGKTKQIQYFDSALNDSDLEKLTSWVSFSDMANGQLYTIE